MLKSCKQTIWTYNSNNKRPYTDIVYLLLIAFKDNKQKRRWKKKKSKKMYISTNGSSYIKWKK